MATKTINNFGVITNLANNDKIPLWQVSSAATKAITYSNFTTAVIASMGNSFVKADGSVALTGNWDIGNGQRILADGIRARAAAGLRLEEDGGALGVFVQDSTGFVGIGTASPAVKLHVENGGVRSRNGNGGYIDLQPGDASNLGYVAWYKPDGTRLAYMGHAGMVDVTLALENSADFVVAGGNVGIGISTPAALLDVNGAARLAYDTDTVCHVGRAAFGPAANVDWATISHVDRATSSAFGFAHTFAGATWLNANTGQDINFSIGGVQKQLFKADGKVGIGITGPDNLLHVHLASAGTVSAHSNTTMTIEASSNAGLQLLSPDANETHLVFGRASNNIAASIKLSSSGGGDELIFLRSDVAKVAIDTTGNHYPKVDNSFTSGKSGNRWSAVWAATGTIQTSDERQKEQVNSCDLGTEFIRRLEPIRWVFRDEQRPAIRETRIVRLPKTQRSIHTAVVIEEIDGRLVKHAVEQQIDEPVMQERQVYDPAGNPLLVVLEPVIEEVEEEVEVQPPVNLKFQRPHYGLSAQQVKRVMDEMGIADFAGYIYDQETDSYALRYHEFTAPIIKAIQELMARLDRLETQPAKTK